MYNYVTGKTISNSDLITFLHISGTLASNMQSSASRRLYMENSHSIIKYVFVQCTFNIL